MKFPANSSRRKFVSQTVATGLGLSLIPSLVTGGCGREVSKDIHPEKWGLVTFFNLDPDWPKKPEGTEWLDIPGLDVDANDNVWLLNRNTPVIEKYDADGNFLTSWGGLGEAVTSVKNGPVDLTFAMEQPRIHQVKIDHEGNVWIATWRLGVVYKCTPEGKVLLVLGTYGEIGEDETHFGEPNDMTITPTGEIFVADGERNFRVVHFDPDGKFIKEWGKRGNGPGEFICPHAIDMDSKGRLYVAERGNSRIQVFDQEGNFIDQWPDIIVPYDLWVDKEDIVWVCGYGPLRHRTDYHLPQTRDQLIMKFNSQGKLLMNWTFGTDSDEPGSLDTIHGLALDSKGNIYTGEHGGRSQKFIPQS